MIHTTPRRRPENFSDSVVAAYIQEISQRSAAEPAEKRPAGAVTPASASTVSRSPNVA
jgi:hypothetical protein